MAYYSVLYELLILQFIFRNRLNVNVLIMYGMMYFLTHVGGERVILIVSNARTLDLVYRIFLFLIVSLIRDQFHVIKLRFHE